MRPFSYPIVAFIVTLISCHAIAGDADDAKKLQGAWEIVELIAYGKKVDFDTIKGAKFIFAGNKLTLQMPAKARLEELVPATYSFKLDPKKNPAEVDLTVLDGNHKGVTSPGIYELKDGTLRWCQSDAPKASERPKVFTSPEKSSIYLFTFRRTK